MPCVSFLVDALARVRSLRRSEPSLWLAITLLVFLVFGGLASAQEARTAPLEAAAEEASQPAAMSVKLPPDVLEGRRAAAHDSDPVKLAPESEGAATPGWTTILYEDAEGSFPSGNGWTVLDGNASSGNDYWDDVSCRSYSGSWSVWSADIGDQTDCFQYDNDMTSWMIYGPFSLADASAARAEFRVWAETERPDIPYDYFFWGASADGSNFNGFRLTANTGWTLRELDLTNVPTLGDLTGDSSVWFAFLFSSDSTVNGFEGAYVDEILIEKLTSGASADLVANDVYFRDQPNGGSLITNPSAGQSLYPHVEFTVDSSTSVSGKLWSLEINGSPLCSSTTTLSPGSYVGWCNSAISLQAGLHSLHGEVDPDGTFSETNENNNDQYRNYTVGGSPGSFSLTNEPPVCDTQPPGPSPAVRLNWSDSSGAASYEVYRNGAFYAGGIGGNTYYNSANVTAGQTYTYFVRAVNSSGETDSNTISVTIPSGICEADIRIQPLTLNFASGSLGSAETEDPYLLNLARGAFVPTIGAADAFETSDQARHLLIQFHRGLDDEVRDALSALRVEVIQRVPRRAVVARVPPGVDPSIIPGVRWVGEIRPEWKISRFVETTKFAGWVVVDFFPDVTRQGADSLLESLGSRATPNPHLLPTSRLVAAPRETVAELAQLDEVSWVRVASSAEIAGVEVFHCPGPLTPEGPLASFMAHDDGWDGPGQGSAHDLSYYFANGTSDISGSLEEGEVARAFAEWEKHAAVTYTEVGTPGLDRSMDVSWATGSHGDGNPFDGAGGVLAHNYFPAPPVSEPIGGDMHLDDDESWRIGAGSSGFDLFTVALHEAGHGLGLSHSNDPNAVMFASVSPSTVFTALTADDIAGIQSIYAAASGSDGSFIVFNDGAETLQVNSIAPASSAPWISWSPAAPFSVPPGGSVEVTVTVNLESAPTGQSTRRLLVSSNDPDENPYPGGVWVVVDNGSTDGCSAGVQDLVLQNGSVTSSEVYEACQSITAGPSFVVGGPGGHATFKAPTVVLRSGFSVGSGASLTISSEVP